MVTIMSLPRLKRRHLVPVESFSTITKAMLSDRGLALLSVMLNFK